jgi:hypothetical protein
MLNLTDDAKGKLAALKNSPGWRVLLHDVMGGLARAANDELLEMDPSKPETTPQAIALAQAMVRAKYAFVGKVEDEVDFQVQEFLEAAGVETEETETEGADPEEENALPPRGRLPMELGGK